MSYYTTHTTLRSTAKTYEVEPRPKNCGNVKSLFCTTEDNEVKYARKNQFLCVSAIWILRRS